MYTASLDRLVQAVIHLKGGREEEMEALRASMRDILERGPRNVPGVGLSAANDMLLDLVRAELTVALGEEMVRLREEVTALRGQVATLRGATDEQQEAADLGATPPAPAASDQTT